MDYTILEYDFGKGIILKIPGTPNTTKALFNGELKEIFDALEKFKNKHLNEIDEISS